MADPTFPPHDHEAGDPDERLERGSEIPFEFPGDEDFEPTWIDAAGIASGGARTPGTDGGEDEEPFGDPFAEPYAAPEAYFTDEEPAAAPEAPSRRTLTGDGHPREDDDDVLAGIAAIDLPDVPAPVPVANAPAEPPQTTRATRERARRGAVTLGIYVTSAAIYGTLLQPSADGYRVLRRLARQRNYGGGEFGVTLADTVDAETIDDVNVTFGRAGDGTEELFLASEFEGITTLADIEDSLGAPKSRAAPFVFELKDLLDECAAMGYDRPPIAFCVGESEVEYVEIIVPDEKPRRRTQAAQDGQEAAAGAGADVRRERLLARLAESYDAPFEKDRVSFVPMTAREGARRYLAIVPSPEGVLTESLELLREQQGMRTMPLRTADAEVSVLTGLARWAYPPAPQENTAVVAVGAESTLVILLQGDELHHQEHMLSVSTHDSPETICSRVLLQQDVQGVGTVHQVVVLSEEREDELVRGFAAFYPNARVAALRRGLVERGVTPSPGQSMLSARSLPAAGAALRLLLERQKETPFEEVNLLPKRLRRVRPRLEVFIAWHTLVTGVVLFFAVLFFVGLYFAQQSQIREAEARVSALGPLEALSPQALQMRIDSLQAVHRRITQTLTTIDSLLVGTDRWSRSMTLLARASRAAGGAWVEQWSPQEAGAQISGYTITRGQAVELAERLSASINELSFSAIRDFPVYSFVMTVPIPTEMPEVALYLREQVDVPPRAEADPLGEALAPGRTR